MNHIAKGVVCGAMGLSAIAGGFKIGDTPEMSSERIEACSVALEGYPQDSSVVPLECSGTEVKAFQYRTEEVMVTDGSGDAYPIDVAKVIIPSPEDFRRRANEIKQHDANKLPQRLASIAVGLGLGGVVFYEWAINTPERRRTKQED